MRLASALIVALGTATATGASPPLEAAADALLAPYLETENFSGAVLVARGDEVLLAKGYGLASRELGVPVTPETVFHLASVSKPFTAAAVLLEAERGKLALTDPVARFVPDYPRGDEITIHQLLTHTSGIPDVNRLPVYEQLAARPQTPESLVAAFRDEPLEFSPGERYAYSNSNYELLALVLERVSGLRYGDLLRERIFAPLGLAATGHHGDAGAIIPGAAVGYAPVGLGVERAPWFDWSVKTGNGSLYSTVGDLFRFARALVAGRLLSPASVAKAFTDHVDGTGYGWFVRERHGRRQLHINGRSPGFGSYLGIYPDDELTVVVLGNLYNSVATPLGVDLAALVFGEPPTSPRLERRRLSPEDIARTVGTYRFGDDFYEPGLTVAVDSEDGFLFHEGTWLIPVGDRRYLHRGYWSDIEFSDPDERGRYRRVTFDGYVAERLPEP